MMSFENSRTSVTNNFATMQTFHLGDLQISNTSNYKDKTTLYIQAQWKLSFWAIFHNNEKGGCVT